MASDTPSTAPAELTYKEICWDIPRLTSAIEDYVEGEVEYPDEFWVQFKTNNPEEFRKYMEFKVDSTNVGATKMKLDGWLAHFNRVGVENNEVTVDRVYLMDRFKDDRDVKVISPTEIHVESHDQASLKITKESDGKWWIDGKIDLRYDDPYAAVGDVKMIQEAYELASKSDLKKVAMPFEVNFGSGEISIVENGINLDVNRSFHNWVGDAPALEHIVTYMNSKYAELRGGEETVKKESMVASLESELSALRADHLVGPGLVPYETKVINENEVKVSAFGTDIVLVKSEGKWKFEGLQFDELSSALSTAVYIENLEANVWRQGGLVVPSGEAGPFYLMTGGVGIFAHSTAIVDTGLRLRRSGFLLEEEGLNQLVEVLNKRYAEKKAKLDKLQSETEDFGEKAEIVELQGTFDGLKLANPDLRVEVLSANKVQVRSGRFPNVTMWVNKIESGWRMDTGYYGQARLTLDYDSLESAVLDASFTLNMMGEAKKAGIPSTTEAPFKADGGEIVIKNGDEEIDFNRGIWYMPGNERGGVSTDHLAAYLNTFWMAQAISNDPAKKVDIFASKNRLSKPGDFAKNLAEVYDRSKNKDDVHGIMGEAGGFRVHYGVQADGSLKVKFEMASDFDTRPEKDHERAVWSDYIDAIIDAILSDSVLSKLEDISNEDEDTDTILVYTFAPRPERPQPVAGGSAETGEGEPSVEADVTAGGAGESVPPQIKVEAAPAEGAQNEADFIKKLEGDGWKVYATLTGDDPATTGTVVVKGLDKGTPEYKYSRIHHFFGKKGAAMKLEEPTQYEIKVNGKDAEWKVTPQYPAGTLVETGTENRLWVESGTKIEWKKKDVGATVLDDASPPVPVPVEEASEVAPMSKKDLKIKLDKLNLDSIQLKNNKQVVSLLKKQQDEWRAKEDKLFSNKERIASVIAKIEADKGEYEVSVRDLTASVTGLTAELSAQKNNPDYAVVVDASYRTSLGLPEPVKAAA